jgi:hypothetical protein
MRLLSCPALHVMSYPLWHRRTAQVMTRRACVLERHVQSKGSMPCVRLAQRVSDTLRSSRGDRHVVSVTLVVSVTRHTLRGIHYATPSPPPHNLT